MDGFGKALDVLMVTGLVLLITLPIAALALGLLVGALWL